MCLILLAWKVHPDLPLVVAANRDELYDRPTEPAGFWSDAPELLAGRDLRQGGTWLGVTRSGRFAALTNYREPGRVPPPDAPSRGGLVTEFLRGEQAAEAYLAGLRLDAYAGFNLLAGGADGLRWVSNRGGEARELEPGCHGLSNHLLDTPWPKVREGKAALSACLSAPTVDPEDVFALLADRSVAADDELPTTGVGLETERVLAPRFIRSEVYGTRSSTVVLVGADGQVTFVERTFDAGGAPLNTRRHAFTLRGGSR